MPRPKSRSRKHQKARHGPHVQRNSFAHSRAKCLMVPEEQQSLRPPAPFARLDVVIVTQVNSMNVVEMTGQAGHDCPMYVSMQARLLPDVVHIIADKVMDGLELTCMDGGWFRISKPEGVRKSVACNMFETSITKLAKRSAARKDMAAIIQVDSSATKEDVQMLHGLHQKSIMFGTFGPRVGFIRCDYESEQPIVPSPVALLIRKVEDPDHRLQARSRWGTLVGNNGHIIDIANQLVLVPRFSDHEASEAHLRTLRSIRASSEFVLARRAQILQVLSTSPFRKIIAVLTSPDRCRVDIPALNCSACFLVTVGSFDELVDVLAPALNSLYAIMVDVVAVEDSVFPQRLFEFVGNRWAWSVGQSFIKKLIRSLHLASHPDKNTHDKWLTYLPNWSPWLVHHVLVKTLPENARLKLRVDVPVLERCLETLTMIKEEPTSSLLVQLFRYTNVVAMARSTVKEDQDRLLHRMGVLDTRIRLVKDLADALSVVGHGMPFSSLYQRKPPVVIGNHVEECLPLVDRAQWRRIVAHLRHGDGAETTACSDCSDCGDCAALVCELMTAFASNVSPEFLALSQSEVYANCMKYCRQTKRVGEFQRRLEAMCQRLSKGLLRVTAQHEAQCKVLIERNELAMQAIPLLKSMKHVQVEASIVGDRLRCKRELATRLKQQVQTLENDIEPLQERVTRKTQRMQDLSAQQTSAAQALAVQRGKNMALESKLRGLEAQIASVKSEAEKKTVRLQAQWRQTALAMSRGYRHVPSVVRMADWSSMLFVNVE